MRSYYTVLPLAVISLALYRSAEGQSCPDGCHCHLFNVTCSGLGTVPTSFPANTKAVKLSNMNIYTMPRGAFAGLYDLQVIQINTSTIEIIQGCTFDGLKNLKILSLEYVDIQTIEANAFRNLRNIDLLLLHSLNINRLKSYAFSNLQSVQNVTIYGLGIMDIEPHAFYGMSDIHFVNFYANSIRKCHTKAFSNLHSVDTFHMHLNVMETMECNVVEELNRHVSNFMFFSNEFWCGCGMAWMMPWEGNSPLAPFLSFNRCYGPRQFRRKYLDSLDPKSMVCSTRSPDGCSSRQIEPPPQGCGISP